MFWISPHRIVIRCFRTISQTLPDFGPPLELRFSMGVKHEFIFGPLWNHGELSRPLSASVKSRIPACAVTTGIWDFPRSPPARICVKSLSYLFLIPPQYKEWHSYCQENSNLSKIKKIYGRNASSSLSALNGRLVRWISLDTAKTSCYLVQCLLKETR